MKEAPAYSESDLKKAVTDYLTWGQNQGRWWFTRLNSGDFIESRGETRRRIKGCGPGTADFVVIRRSPALGDIVPSVAFLELKSAKGRQTVDQMEFEDVVKRMGSCYHLIRSIKEVEEILGEKGVM